MTTEHHTREQSWSRHEASGVRGYLQVLRRRKWIFFWPSSSSR